jgi:hypothetical protein
MLETTTSPPGLSVACEIILKQLIDIRMGLKMRWSLSQGMVGFVAAAVGGWPMGGLTQSSNYFAGTAVGGQAVNVDLNSIRQVSANSLDFTYYVGSTPIYAQANCPGGYWVTFPERQTNRPQSAATQRMLSKVCSYLSIGAPRETPAPGVALVFDPPSNVRGTPNGSILCSVRTRQAINVYAKEGQWYVTDYCGGRGYIHEGQVRF